MVFMNRFIATIVLSAACITAHAGPFGLNFGDSYAQLSKLGLVKDKVNQWYTAKSVPRPHPDFVTYELLISPKLGLCKIIASNSNISSDSYGSTLRQQYNLLEDSLSRKYGEGKKFDYLKSGSIWDEPRDFMMGLVKDERVLVTYWTVPDPSSHDGVAVISLRADARNKSTGVIIINYESKNGKECIDVAREETNSTL
jgi:hypothetical protein